MKYANILKGALVAGVAILFWGATNAAMVPGHISPAANRPRAITSSDVYAGDQIIVRFRDTQVFGPGDAAALNSQLDTQVVQSYSHFRGLQVLKGRHGQSTKDLLASYRSNPNVLYAEPDYRLEIQLTPNDTRYSEMWGLNNTGQTGGTVDADINAPEAWNITTGSSSVVVGVIDTGIDYTHPDLQANLWVNPGEIPGNLVDDDADGFIDDVYGINAITNTGNPFDDNGHGTHTAGTIGAVGNNSRGVVGVSQQVKIVACKFLSATGGGLTSDAIKCFNYLLMLKGKGVNVVLSSNSWGGGGFSSALRDAIKANQDAGILTVAAAGNSGANTDTVPSYPASYDLPSIISVAATDASDRLASFSNYGSSSVDVGAPGVSILSTFPVASTCTLCTTPNQYDPTGYGVISGTSMATPHVAGLAALLKAQDTSRTWAQIKNLIMTGGQTISALQGKTVSGRRIRAADVNGIGSMTCVNQAIARRIAPAGSSIMIVNGQSIALQYVSLNCDHALSGSITITVQPSGELVTLRDDGVAPDAAAGDGIFSATYIPTVKGTFTFPGNDVVAFKFIKKYLAATLVDYRYRTLSLAATRLGFSDESFWTGSFSGFPIRFRGEIPGYTSMAVGSNGYLGFHGGTFFDNTPLPAIPSSGLPFTVETFVAAYWDDFNPVNDQTNNFNQAAFVETQGVAPFREFIVEFRNMPHKRGLISDTGTFQVVFFENSPDVLVNYKDVKFGNSLVDYGAEATFGIQSHPTIFQQDKYNAAYLTDNMSLLWQLGQPPVARAGSNQVVNSGNTVLLDGTGSTDADGTIESYGWVQTAGPAVTLIGGSAAKASFTAPNVAGTLSFRLTVTDDDGASSTSNVSIRVNAAPTANVSTSTVVNFGKSVNLDGSASTDSDGTIFSYSWAQVSGPAVTITNGNAAIASFVAPNTAGILTFQLTVTDNNGATNSRTVSMRVNSPPAVNAGGAQVVGPGAIVTLNGNATTDSDGIIATFSWVQTSGTPVSLATSNTSASTFTAPSVAGNLVFQLTATDNDGGVASSTVTIAVTLPNSQSTQGSQDSKGGGGGTDELLLALLVVLCGVVRVRGYKAS